MQLIRCNETLLRNLGINRDCDTPSVITVAFILSYLSTFSITTEAIHDHLCLKDDYTNDLPIFVEKRTICNYESVPVLAYSVKITPDADHENKLCLDG